MGPGRNRCNSRRDGGPRHAPAEPAARPQPQPPPWDQRRAARYRTHVRRRARSAGHAARPGHPGRSRRQGELLLHRRAGRGRARTDARDPAPGPQRRESLALAPTGLRLVPGRRLRPRARSRARGNREGDGHLSGLLPRSDGASQSLLDYAVHRAAFNTCPGRGGASTASTAMPMPSSAGWTRGLAAGDILLLHDGRCALRATVSRSSPKCSRACSRSSRPRAFDPSRFRPHAGHRLARATARPRPTAARTRRTCIATSSTLSRR